MGCNVNIFTETESNGQYKVRQQVAFLFFMVVNKSLGFNSVLVTNRQKGNAREMSMLLKAILGASPANFD